MTAMSTMDGDFVISTAAVHSPAALQSSLNATAATLLGFLDGGPKTGWDLAEAVAATIGPYWNVTRSQVYRELRTLESLGLIEHGSAGTRARRPATITAAGRAAFRAWIRREPADDIVRSPLLLTVFFGDHLPPVLLDRFLELHRLRHRRRLRRCSEQLAASSAAPGGGGWSTEILRYAVLQERATLEWLDGLQAGAGEAAAEAR